MNLTLQRTLQTIDCTTGTIDIGGARLFTLELPWLDATGFPGGDPQKSCVPAGVYDLVLHNTPKHPKTFALVNRELWVIHEPDASMPNARVACLIHVANFVRELLGCIGIGTLMDACYVGNSQLAMHELNAAVPWVPGHTLTILGPPL